MLCLFPRHSPRGSGAALGSSSVIVNASTQRTASIEELQRAAQRGDAKAQDDLGCRYARGEGVPQDYMEAVRFFRLSAEQGFAWGQYHLGFANDEGNGVPQELAEAAKWYRLAADQGNPQAQNDLAMCYHQG